MDKKKCRGVLRQKEITVRGESTERLLCILVADDNRINRIYIQKILAEDGHTVELAENGREAIEKMAQGKEFHGGEGAGNANEFIRDRGFNIVNLEEIIPR